MTFVLRKLEVKPKNIMPVKKEDKGVVYNPSKDIDYVMSGKLVDMYD